MDTRADQLIAIEEFCAYYNVERAFVSSVHEIGLIEVVQEEGSAFIPHEALPQLERIVRLHRELEINTEGIEAIMHLLNRVERLQHEVAILQHRLRQYEL
ncbi:hypothetical protein GCM10027275_16960 [Rhabdobacter roseus]|uniref:MerR family transcriptional regulator n=1 Tax=Rhabdobacter roseus TaxID=1655419 RepID=A0A840TUF5_9BACT|nr:chaperone modulator CbpM [Rhabdobacter roseus]MBB5283620.1 hypothetical protein [Rhabdobacter roseus]